MNRLPKKRSPSSINIFSIMPPGFAVSVNEDKERFLHSTGYLPKLHKKAYKARFIAYSCSCATTELSKLLTFCLATIKNYVIKYCEKA